MISYKVKENQYSYSSDDLEEILKVLEEGNQYGQYGWTKESISFLISTIEKFLNNIKVSQHIVEKERHETEEEARAYFGGEFIRKWNDLLTTLDKQQTIVSLHGTNPSVCPAICENGLMYKSPSITATACGQTMNYGSGEMDYQDFESLLNWGHRRYKGLVILAIPYECYYKEGLWRHFRKSEYSEFSYEYRIDPDFVVGYIDVEQKKIILNPKYKREHDYSEYEKDTEVFRKQENMNNDRLAEIMISMKSMDDYPHVDYSSTKEEEVTIDDLSLIIEELTMQFNSIKNGYYNGVISEERYKLLLESLSRELKRLKQILPLIEQKQKPFISVFDEPMIESDDVWEESKNQAK